MPLCQNSSTSEHGMTETERKTKRWTEKTAATDRRERDEVKSISLHVCKQDDGAEGVVAKGGGGVTGKKKKWYSLFGPFWTSCVPAGGWGGRGGPLKVRAAWGIMM